MRILRIEELHRDVIYGIRHLRRSPAFTLAVVLTLALAIGPNASVFALVERVALMPGVIGIYGVVSYIVSQRTTEIGIRLVLASFCLETRESERCAVTDRAYSVDFATVGAVYDRPIFEFRDRN